MGRGKRAVFPGLTLILTLLIIGLIPPSEAATEEQVTIRGTVLDFKTQEPIVNATTVIWENYVLVAQKNTNTFGLFTVQVPKGRSYRIYIYANVSNTPGWDYLPAIKATTSLTSDMDFMVELRSGASVIIEKDIQFVETTTSPTTYTYEVCDPESGATLNIEGYKFLYGTPESAQTRFLGLSYSHLVVPAEISFSIRVNASAIVGGKIIAKSFNIDEPNHLRLSKGDLVRLDVRKYALPYNLAVVENEIDAVEAKIDEMDKLGFYLFLEKQRFTTITGAFDRAKFSLFQGLYVDSFKESRRAYVDITDLFNSLNGMYSDAVTSVYVLLFFLAFASTTISFLLFDKLLYKVVVSGILTALVHVVLHTIYPAITYVSVATFAEFSAIAWCVALFVTIIFPQFMKGRATDGKTPLRNIVVPIFSLAKRSLTRRRLRFVLTLFSVMMLVMSFVALTSFTMGYGLIINRLSNQYLPVSGVLVRAPSGELKLGEHMFTPLDKTAIEWLQKQGEVEIVAPKAETQPLLVATTALSGTPIFGVVGILPSAEARLLGFDKIVVEGNYLRDGEENTILISGELKDKLGIKINATLRLGREMVRVVGIYSEEKLKWLNDMDGTPVTPNKLVNLSPPGEPPNIVATPVEADELVICGLETALKIPGVFLSRIDAMLKKGEVVNGFAERVALERNYDVWASSSAGLYVAMLGVYFQGKGVPLAVPWAIVVLNVVISMLNVLYERRKEIGIFSSVGLNPSHIAGIFVAEAVAIGLIGGGVGYLLGLSMYKVMALLHITLEVRQKVSAFWSLGALAISMTAVIIGAISALKGSVIITPSLLRRWRVEVGEVGMATEIGIPVRVPEDEIEEFTDYLLKVLRSYEDDPTFRTERIRISREETEEGSLRTVIFVYRMVGGAFASFSHNRLFIRRERGEKVYTVKMTTSGDNRGIYQAGSLVRMIIMRWSTRK